MSRFEELEAFVRTAEAGSFTAAAHQLRVAKSAVSRRISDLEQRLNVQLIVRTTRALALTEAGETLFQRARRLLDDWDEAETAASDGQARLSGSIRLAVPLSFGIDHLSASLIEFQAAHPLVRLDVDFSDRHIDLVAEGIDLAVRIGVLPDSTLVARRLAPVRMVVCASPDFIERHGVPEKPSDLSTLADLRYSNRTEAKWTFTAPNGSTEAITLKPGLSASNGAFLKDAAIAGHGVTILPSFILYDALKDGRLIRLLPNYQLPMLGIFAVYPSTRHLSKRVRALVDHLAKHCGETPYWDQW